MLCSVTWYRNNEEKGPINEFGKITGVPVLLNTSFNENEPIVCTPEHAVKSFLKTDFDILSIGNFIVTKNWAQNY